MTWRTTVVVTDDGLVQWNDAPPPGKWAVVLRLVEASGVDTCPECGKRPTEVTYGGRATCRVCAEAMAHHAMTGE